MEKLLHERLREWVKKSEQEDHLPTTVAHYDLELDNDSVISEQIALFNYFANEIERYYIPRPRDNKGIPFVEGEIVWSTDPDTEYSAEVISVGESTILILWDDGPYDVVDACDMQHEKPDSLEKLLDDIRAWNKEHGVNEVECWEARLSAFIERRA